MMEPALPISGWTMKMAETKAMGPPETMETMMGLPVIGALAKMVKWGAM